MLGQRGIFLTFMAFLLVSTVLGLSISISQTAIKQERNLAQDIALKETNSLFNNIRQQILVAKEGYAGASYGRLMPFDEFRAGDNWFQIEQTLPYLDTHLKKTYDALNLFEIFAEAKSSKGMEVEIDALIKNIEWGGTEQFPKIEYLVLPQCLRFEVGGANMDADGGAVKFAEGTVAEDGCSFQQGSIKSNEAKMQLIDWSYSAVSLLCSGDFSSCANNGNESQQGYAKVEIELNNCPYPCSNTDFDNYGKAIISTNFTGPGDPPTPVPNTWVQIQDLEKNATLSIDNNCLIEINNNIGSGDSKKLIFNAKVEFYQSVEEIVLATDLFDYSVKKSAFGLCRATNESGCGT